MQIRSFRGSGEPAWVNAPSSACFRLGPDPRRALGPAATPAAQTGRTRDRTRPMLQQRRKVLAMAPSTRDPTADIYYARDEISPRGSGFVIWVTAPSLTLRDIRGIGGRMEQNLIRAGIKTMA